MPHYKDQNNGLHYLEAGAYENLLPTGCVKITDAEATALQLPTIAHTKAERWGVIKAERDRRTEAGGYKVPVVGKWFHSDQKSRSQQQDNEAEGSALLPVAWKTMDGTFVTMTADLAAQVRAARMASDRAIFSVAEAHRVAMEASADPAVYNFMAGWPKIFGEE